jgi:hypothetical protein
VFSQQRGVVWEQLRWVTLDSREGKCCLAGLLSGFNCGLAWVKPDTPQECSGFACALLLLVPKAAHGSPCCLPLPLQRRTAGAAVWAGACTVGAGG